MNARQIIDQALASEPMEETEGINVTKMKPLLAQVKSLIDSGIKDLGVSDTPTKIRMVDIIVHSLKRWAEG